MSRMNTESPPIDKVLSYDTVVQRGCPGAPNRPTKPKKKNHHHHQIQQQQQQQQQHNTNSSSFDIALEDHPFGSNGLYDQTEQQIGRPVSPEHYNNNMNYFGVSRNLFQDGNESATTRSSNLNGIPEQREQRQQSEIRGGQHSSSSHRSSLPKCKKTL